MTLAQARRTPQRQITTDHILTAPLPDLLAELHVELVESGITEPKFTGTAVRDGGLTVLALPPGRPDWERDMIARQLLGTLFDVPMPDLPGEYRITELEPELLAA
ncbi:hypothetical protein [Streptomyces sp. MZ04]|uniref:hypothetical protein n=1 Tax=Streptomyces sp. MZ04 TaxID=2559236 RepID=UPI00107E781D|nr:hypothetical protein [Streptomyces sp. MZ04]TGB06534.1 hypothetical protein E2651_23255 [Streptomyces sp. MZ04]